MQDGDHVEKTKKAGGKKIFEIANISFNLCGTFQNHCKPDSDTIGRQKGTAQAKGLQKFDPFQVPTVKKINSTEGTTPKGHWP